MTRPRLLSRLEHDRTGAGEPVVLIHGIGHRRQTWDPVTDLLAERYEVIRPDLAGFGMSPAYPSGTPHTMENACADLAANFAEWGVERPHVVGNSLGGAIALELAARDLVASATALSPAGFFRGPLDRGWALATLALVKLSAMLPDRVLEATSRSSAGRRVAGAMLYAHPERTTAADVYGDALALKRSPAFFPTLRAGLRYSFEATGIGVPVTVAWGTRDRLLLPGQAELARRRLPEARHVPLPGCGHIPMIDSPELVVSLVEETIGEVGASEVA